MLYSKLRHSTKIEEAFVKVCQQFADIHFAWFRGVFEKILKVVKSLQDL